MHLLASDCHPVGWIGLNRAHGINRQSNGREGACAIPPAASGSNAGDGAVQFWLHDWFEEASEGTDAADVYPRDVQLEPDDGLWHIGKLASLQSRRPIHNLNNGYGDRDFRSTAAHLDLLPDSKLGIGG
jgi:hypothetical protein